LIPEIGDRLVTNIYGICAKFTPFR
jgi:hypothetical protein